MEQPIGLRLPVEFVQKIEMMSKKEREDRSTTMRKLLIEGYQQKMKKQAIEEYKRGKITLSEAAKRASLTLWEIEQELVISGFKKSIPTKRISKNFAISLKSLILLG